MIKHSKTIGLALGSGGWKGLAHLGLISSLLKHGFEINFISGSSAGALIGAMYSISGDINLVIEKFKTLTIKELIYIFSDPNAKLGLFGNQKPKNLIEKFIQKASFKDCQIPLTIVATNLLTSDPVIFNEGSLVEAIFASTCIPVIFSPVIADSKLLADGGLSRPLPIREVRMMGSDIVIASSLYQSEFPVNFPKKLSKTDIVNISYQGVLNQLARTELQYADIVIEPEFAQKLADPFSKFINNQEAITAGEIAMDKNIDLLKDLIRS